MLRYEDQSWHPLSGSPSVALVLPGGGARGAYQAGVLAAIAQRVPEFRPDIVTGVSAGAINAAFLVRSEKPFGEATAALAKLWGRLTTSMIVRDETRHVAANAGRWALRLVSGSARLATPVALLDTSPLRALLEAELAPRPTRRAKPSRSSTAAWAVTATNYCSGRAETFVEVTGRHAPTWERPYRRGVAARITVDHVMASCALPILFPPVRIDQAWYGDGGVRQDAPLSPALHLGADRALVISTSAGPNAPRGAPHEAEDATAEGVHCSEPGRVLSVVLNALIHDHVDHDVAHLARITRLVAAAQAPVGALRSVESLVIRPSADLGALASQCEAQLAPPLRHLLRGWGTGHSRSSDLLSTLLFERSFTSRLIELGRRDALAQMGAILRFLDMARPLLGVEE